MSRFEFKLPDLGEGTVDAEIVEWKVKVGDQVKEDDVIVDVMTDKANIEVPSPVSGTVLETTGEPGDLVPVGSTLIVFEVAAGAKVAVKPVVVAETAAAPVATTVRPTKPTKSARPAAERTTAAAMSTPQAVLTSPSIRRRAREAGIELTEIHGSGPDGRITQADFDAHVAKPRAKSAKATKAVVTGDVEEIKIIGVRRVIAQRLSEAKRSIPHFAYVEEVDVTELESLRAHLNDQRDANLTYLPFLAMALVRALPEFPQCNAHYDAERGVLQRHRRVHLGVATQTPDGLKVPVVHNAQELSLWDLAREIRRVSDAARNNKATKDELHGSTITITSLGRLGGIASTPIINAPEVGIIGVNKAVQRPMVVAGAVTIRLMMNLSSSFDHRFVDGYDAAALIQTLKEHLEHPATIFIDG
ncbi:MAG TPA: dihydrolipoamide acetyltransferase family protein [Pseudomonadales bacterium]|nr:dihydrolipoamide acetyltransferase family protein [Pseudomonadales bacterium]